MPVIRGVTRQRKRILRTALMSTFQKERSDAWADYIDFVSTRGRAPADGEVKTLQTAADHGLAPADLWDAATRMLPKEQLAEQRRRRYNQYLVFVAISRFRGVPRLRDLPITSPL